LNAQGAWYSPRHSGSGLTLLHTRSAGADSLVGMWMNFDSFGAPRWYLLANAAWTSPMRVEGTAPGPRAGAAASDDEAGEDEVGGGEAGVEGQSQRGIRH
jgi:hypothetical protein